MDQAVLREFAMKALHTAVRAFERCQVGYCGKRSLGMVCSGCSNFVCLNHGYLTSTVPPKAVCEACIGLRWRDDRRAWRDGSRQKRGG